MRNPSVPLRPDRRGHATSELLSARIGIWEILDEVLGRFLVFLLRDNDMRLSCISALRSVYSGDLLDQTRSRSRLFGAATAP